MEENNEQKVVEEVKEEKTVEEAKPVYKKHGPVYWIIVIVGMAVIVSLSVLMGERLAKGSSPKSKKQNTTSNVTSNKEEQKTELTEADKEKIAKKLATVLGDPEYTYGKVITSTDLEPSAGRVFTNFEEKDKLKLLFNSIKPSNATIDYAAVNMKDASIAQMIKVNPDPSTMQIFNGEEVAKAYKELYGTDITYVDVPVCPGYYYDSNSKYYISVGGCGGVSIYEQYVYIDEITAQDNSIVISTYVGSLFGSPDGEVVYNDYLSSFDNITAQKTTEKEITSTNKTSFTKYNFTFEKASDGEYYYKNVAKAN